MKRFFVRTYGCQMNELDSEVMAGLLQERGLVQTDQEEEADLLLFNTCSIRDLAERKVMGKLGKLGRKKKKCIIGVTGCMANAKKETLFRKLPHVDFVLGTNNIHDLNTVLDEVLEQKGQVLRTDDRFSKELDYTVAKRQDKYKAYVSIIRGCDKYCTYCVVPYTRGPEVSRPLNDVVSECQKLIDSGYREITLLGQNVNSFGKDNQDVRFHDLLYALDKINGLNRVRFLTSHPVDITRELMEAIRDLDSLCEHVHFPLQAGSSRILRKMHRIYKKEEYYEKVAMLREIVPNVALGTDMIVGFPTETEEEFEETCQAMRDIRYSNAFLYTYSPRKGTPAKRWVDDIPEEVKNRRHQKLLALHQEIAQELLQEKLGESVEVLVERRNKDGKHLKGVSRCWRNVIFEGGDELIGTLQRVKLHSYSHNTLIGILEE
ncbi:MAG: tRNA-2-methylthio-N(6)-dimethylallyladenosine synthase [Chlamydiales bacterium]|nr:tRNA-2-methylthio-N(6)-dimethylallyladenosine synthase [Chlamydiales bacterium]MCH9636156.1 tRNA-2-methylthio-N(6)-dimethylallyladenosine synthase [Chlamydiales bacterium]